MAKFTVLKSEEGWTQFHQLHLAHELSTGVRGHPEHPQYLVLDGHFRDAQIRDILPKEFTVKTVVGVRQLPEKFAAQVAATARRSVRP